MRRKRLKKNKRPIKAIDENALLKKRIEKLECDISFLQSSVFNLQNLTRILERDICNCRDIAAIGEAVKDSVLKEKR